MIKCISILVIGKVQGVFFRASAKAKADELGVKGFVHNKEDGSVYIQAEASNEALMKLIDWCRKGPPHAQVERIETSDVPLTNAKDFFIKR